MLWHEAEISLYYGATDATPAKTTTVSAVLHRIRTGVYRQTIKRLRYILATQGDSAYTVAKARLAAVTFCGIFTPTRSKGNLVQHSGLIHGDLDHLLGVQAVKQALCTDPHTTYCFVSPSGNGLKLGVYVAPVSDDAAYKHAWQVVTDYYQRQYGVMWDPSGKDICRLCFVSWDPELYGNPTAQPFLVPPALLDMPHVPAPPSPRRLISKSRCDYYAQWAIDTAIKMIDTSTPGNRHHARTKAAFLLGGYVAGDMLTINEARAALAAAVARNTEHFERSMRTIEDCLQAGMKAAITLEHLEQERSAWLRAYESRTFPDMLGRETPHTITVEVA